MPFDSLRFRSARHSPRYFSNSTERRGQGRGRTVIPGFAVRYIAIMLPSQTRHLMCQSQTVVLSSLFFIHMLWRAERHSEKKTSRWQDSNLWPSVPKTDALTRLRYTSSHSPKHIDPPTRSMNTRTELARWTPFGHRGQEPIRVIAFFSSASCTIRLFAFFLLSLEFAKSGSLSATCPKAFPEPA